MIFNRKEDDVIKAREIREEKVKKFLQLTDEEKEIMERGCVLPSTINRISEKQTEVVNLCCKLGYYGPRRGFEAIKELDTDEVFYNIDLVKIVSNTKTIRENFIMSVDTPVYFSARYHWDDFNSIEKVLFDSEKNAKYIEENASECDTFECGEI